MVIVGADSYTDRWVVLAPYFHTNIQDLSMSPQVESITHVWHSKLRRKKKFTHSKFDRNQCCPLLIEILNDFTIGFEALKIYTYDDLNKAVSGQAKSKPDSTSLSLC